MSDANKEQTEERLKSSVAAFIKDIVTLTTDYNGRYSFADAAETLDHLKTCLDENISDLKYILFKDENEKKAEAYAKEQSDYEEQVRGDYYCQAL